MHIILTIIAEELKSRGYLINDKASDTHFMVLNKVSRKDLVAVTISEHIIDIIAADHDSLLVTTSIDINHPDSIQRITKTVKEYSRRIHEIDNCVKAWSKVGLRASWPGAGTAAPPFPFKMLGRINKR